MWTPHDLQVTVFQRAHCADVEASVGAGLLGNGARCAPDAPLPADCQCIQPGNDAIWLARPCKLHDIPCLPARSIALPAHLCQCRAALLARHINGITFALPGRSAQHLEPNCYGAIVMANYACDAPTCAAPRMAPHPLHHSCTRACKHARTHTQNGKPHTHMGARRQTLAQPTRSKHTCTCVVASTGGHA